MKIAFATRDMEFVNDHFGWAKQFAVYEIDTKGHKLVETLTFEEGDGHEDGRLESRIDKMSDCAIVYLNEIGPSAAARLVKKRVHPVKTRGIEAIDHILENLRDVLMNSPPPWLKKIMNDKEE